MRCNGTELVDARSQVWDDNTLSWVPERQAVVSTDTLNVTLPATAATAAKQDTGNTSLASIAASVGGTLAVSGPLTDSQLRATAVPVSATNLDIRDLSSATDSIAVTDGGGSLTVDGTVGVSGSVAVTNAALSVTGGGVEATALRVTVASDSTGVLSVDDNGGSLTVDGTVGVSGSVAVTNAALSVTGGGVEASALRVTIASDSTGVLSVDDNGSSLTVDGTVAVSGVGGTVAVTQSGTWDEVGINDSGNSITVDAPVGTPVFVRLSDGAAALTTTSGRLAVDPSGVTSPISAASLPLPTGAATAALQTQPGVDIGDVTINNASGASAVNIQDGGNSITVDGTVAVSGTVTVAETGYITRLEEASATITYVGQAAPGSATSSAVWRVKRLDSAAGLVVLYADGNTNFDNTWDGRAGFSYS